MIKKWFFLTISDLRIESVLQLGHCGMCIDFPLQLKVIQVFSLVLDILLMNWPLFAHTFAGIFRKTFAKFGSHFDSSWYGLMPQFLSGTECILSSVYVKFYTVPTTKRYASFKSNACSWETHCASKGAEFIPNCWIQTRHPVLFDPYFSIGNNDTFICLNQIQFTLLLLLYLCELQRNVAIITL